MPIRATSLVISATACFLGALPAIAQEAVDCRQFNSIASYAPGPGMEITFTNASESRRTVMWQDTSGAPVYLMDLNVGESAGYMVGPGDIFAMVDGPGNCVEMFRATAGQSQYVMRAIATGAGGD